MKWKSIDQFERFAARPRGQQKDVKPTKKKPDGHLDLTTMEFIPASSSPEPDFYNDEPPCSWDDL